MGSIREVNRKDGNKSYHAEVRMKGYPSQRASFRTRSLAKKWIQDTESGIRDGRHFRTVEAKRHTVGEMVERFINQWLPRYPKRRAKQTALLSWWKERCGHLLLSDLTPSVIVECREFLLSETTNRGGLRSPATVNRYLSALGKVLTVTMKEWGWIEENPMAKVSKPQEPSGRERLLSMDEKNRLLEACTQSKNLNLYPMVKLSLLTAMRMGELSGLRWRDVDFELKKIFLNETKNGDRRVLPLSPEVEETLKVCPTFGGSLSGLIFQSENNNGEEKKVSVRTAFECALKRAEIEDFRWHDIRHAAASFMAMGGATQGELMAILGHRSPVMTKRYAHYSQEHLGKVMRSLSESLFGNSEGVE